ncbi:hypothetical protein GH740_03240 [Microbacterium sp. SYP-A9085]|uniref:DUF6186 family protein n=1 Tax=Microbacterium sp. SYP-A9085 TaxID=2664454 RepID=UPI00129BB47B|nr:DUF6186 family protein [Microbacterium sp. SYP-A9085]MRH28328.1 hypothetical protein [Microbacterium sp. SYP-A9085]
MIVISAGAFLTCAAALAVAGWVIGRRHAEASVTAMFDRLMSEDATRIAVIVVWWWLGWHFLAGQTL